MASRDGHCFLVGDNFDVGRTPLVEFYPLMEEIFDGRAICRELKPGDLGDLLCQAMTAEDLLARVTS